MPSVFHCRKVYVVSSSEGGGGRTAGTGGGAGESGVRGGDKEVAGELPAGAGVAHTEHVHGERGAPRGIPEHDTWNPAPHDTQLTGG